MWHCCAQKLVESGKSTCGVLNIYSCRLSVSSVVVRYIYARYSHSIHVYFCVVRNCAMYIYGIYVFVVKIWISKWDTQICKCMVYMCAM